MENSTLKKVVKTLDTFFCYFKHDDIIAISEEKDMAPFAYVLFDDSYPDNLLISLAVDYPIASTVAKLVLLVNKTSPLLVADNFYINQMGQTLWNEEADYAFELDMIDLDQCEPITDILQ